MTDTDWQSRAEAAEAKLREAEAPYKPNSAVTWLRPTAKEYAEQVMKMQAEYAASEARVRALVEAGRNIARVASWSGLYDHNTDGLPVNIFIKYPAGTTEHKLTGKDMRLFGEAFEAAATLPTAQAGREGEA